MDDEQKEAELDARIQDMFSHATWDDLSLAEPDEDDDPWMT